MTDEWPICPLCGEFIDEEDERRHVWHSAPRPRTGMIEGYAEADDRVAGGGMGFVLDRSLGEIAALLDALKSADHLEFTTSPVVDRIEPGEGGITIDGKADPTPMTVTRDEEAAGATIRLEAPDPPDPDATLHAECHAAVFGTDDD